MKIRFKHKINEKELISGEFKGKIGVMASKNSERQARKASLGNAMRRVEKIFGQVDKGASYSDIRRRMAYGDERGEASQVIVEEEFWKINGCALVRRVNDRQDLLGKRDLEVIFKWVCGLYEFKVQVKSSEYYAEKYLRQRSGEYGVRTGRPDWKEETKKRMARSKWMVINAGANGNDIEANRISVGKQIRGWIELGLGFNPGC